MSYFYDEAHRGLQDAHDTRGLAEMMEHGISTEALDERQSGFIASLDMFFLATVDAQGNPTVSYKGGAPGFVRVLDDHTLVFPVYDGNGMFLSAGNLATTQRVGLLFIDFATPNRLRVQGAARIVREHALLADYPGALFLVEVAVERAWPNCARYVHKRVKVEDSKYVPRADCETPRPAWKRIDLVQDHLPASEQGRTAAEGGVITNDEYVEKLMRGES